MVDDTGIEPVFRHYQPRMIFENTPKLSVFLGFDVGSSPYT